MKKYIITTVMLTIVLVMCTASSDIRRELTIGVEAKNEDDPVLVVLCIADGDFASHTNKITDKVVEQRGWADTPANRDKALLLDSWFDYVKIADTNQEYKVTARYACLWREGGYPVDSTRLGTIKKYVDCTSYTNTIADYLKDFLDKHGLQDKAGGS